jgi:2-keto-4-pentenoate hydratase/2-oxohepta-3-ene-1,7-dioic acid hydratase in catechol pathway
MVVKMIGEFEPSFKDKSFCVGQNFISHVKLMQKSLK